jgi:hypothetical protein
MNRTSCLFFAYAPIVVGVACGEFERPLGDRLHGANQAGETFVDAGSSTGGNAAGNNTGGESAADSGSGAASTGGSSAQSGDCFSPTHRPELALSGAASGCACSNDEPSGCVTVVNDQGRPHELAFMCLSGTWRSVEDGPCWERQGVACKVNGVVYPSGTSNIPDPVSCNSCSCEGGSLGCTTIGCHKDCPAGTAEGQRCAQCGIADGCDTVESGCLPACNDDSDCESEYPNPMPSCVDGICKQVCPAATILCGNDRCDPGTEKCTANAYRQTPATCAPVEVYVCGGGCVIAACDGPEDCPEGESCVHQFGENDYFLCQETRAEGIVCSDDSDCAMDFPHCEYVEPSDVLETLLGWRPGFCAQGF